jgi:ribose transport system substrate-binding protein
LSPLASLRRSGAILCVICGAALALGACGDDEDEPSGGGSGAGQQKEVRVGIFMASLGDGYTQALNDSVGKEAKALGATSQTFNANFDPAKQLQQCQDAIVTQKFQAFIIQSVDGPSMVPCARQAVDAGIKVVAVSNPIGPKFDTTAPQVKGLTGTILESPSTMGRALADLTADACKGKDPCQVIYEFGPPDFSFAANSRKVFNAEAGKGQIDVVAEGSHEFVPDKARSLTTQFLVAHPDVDVITSDDDPSAAAALAVVKRRGLEKQVTVIGGAGSQEGQELVQSGEMFGSAVLVPRSAGKKATEIAVKAARGESPGKTEFNNAEDLSSIGPTLTKENAAQFKAEWSVGG